MKLCGNCEDNEHGLCDRYGRLVEDDDSCEINLTFKCSWCGSLISYRGLKRTKEKHADYSYFCQKCNAMRFIREVDLDG